jgi:uncharacterized membrane protein YeaQ/YmgE (transglycosylase-associated protein family)
MSYSPEYAWVAIGLAASLAAMILPFRRGAGGIAANLIAGAVGGPLGAMVLGAILPRARPGMQLGFAAIGALVALAIVHVGWQAFASAHARRHGATTR